VRLTLPSGTPAELAIPPAPVRGVVVIPDIMGLRPLFDDMVARLAAEHAWAVCAFEPFPECDLPTVEERLAAMPTLRDEQVLGDAVAAADLITARAGVERVGVIGFCMGGMYTIKAAGTGRFDRAVPFYGMIRVPAAWRGAGQGEPLDALARPGACPVLAIIGGRDTFTPSDDVAALEAVGPQVNVVRYPEAEHGFVHDPARPAHRSADAADAWARAVAFLAAT